MKGIIYKIELNENNIYVGSTTQKLCRRQVNHNQSLKKRPHQKLYKSCIENNIKYIKCIWVADIEYNSIAELRKIEEEYRKKLIANLNSYRCYITEEETKELKKKYYEQNKIKISEYQKEYHKQNKIELNEKYKEYCEQNKDKLNEKNKKYREQNKDKIKEYREQNKDKKNEKQREKIKCNNCDCLISKSSLKRHQKTMKCLLFSECIFTDEE
jgi:hypothetical protein